MLPVLVELAKSARDFSSGISAGPGADSLDRRKEDRSYLRLDSGTGLFRTVRG